MFSRGITRSTRRCFARLKIKVKSSKATPDPTPIIKKFPVFLNLIYPEWDIPAIHQFNSRKELNTFLSKNILFLFDIKTGNAIHPHQSFKIDPNVTYDVAGPDTSYRDSDITSDEIWDMAFEGKTAAALKGALKTDGEEFIELSRVVRDPETGLNVGNWEMILEVSDGTLIFLETDYRMTKVSYHLQAIYFRSDLHK